ncbi:MAG TPA: RHS repeat-associated core domain-containing protein [Galbitalea sp.]
MYDAFGRQTTIPAADAPDGANAAISLSYFDTDSVQSITQTVGGVTTASTFGLDPDGRRATESITGSSPSTITDHYVDGSDSPGYAPQVGSSTTTYSSYLQGLSGLGATVTTQGGTSTASLDFSDLSGSIVATVGLTSGSDATGLTASSATDEYGNSSTANSNTGVLNYGWEGGAQREVSNAGLTLMGARVYDPTRGRFSSTDPVAGGNEDDYNYPDDPTVSQDSTGESSKCHGRSKSTKSNHSETVNGRHWVARWWDLWLNECEVSDVLANNEWNQTWVGVVFGGLGFSPLSVLAWGLGGIIELLIGYSSRELSRCDRRHRGVHMWQHDNGGHCVSQ